MATAQHKQDQQQQQEQQQQQQQTCWWSYTWPHSRGPQTKASAVGPGRPPSVLALGVRPLKRTGSSGSGGSGGGKKRLQQQLPPQQQQQQQSQRIVTLTIKAGSGGSAGFDEKFQRSASPQLQSSVLARRQPHLMQQQQQQQQPHLLHQPEDKQLSVCLQCAAWVECQSAHRQATGHVTYQPVSAATAAYYKCLECYQRMVNQRQVSEHMHRAKHVNYVRLGLNGCGSALLGNGLAAPTAGSVGTDNTGEFFDAAAAFVASSSSSSSPPPPPPPSSTETFSIISPTTVDSSATVLAALNFADCDRLLDPFAMFDDSFS